MSITEGANRTKLMTFTVTLSTAADGPVTVRYATQNGSATSGKDYTSKSPQAAGFWNTLGVARYRAGEFKQAVADLEKSTQLRKKGGSSEDFFFLSMAHWQLGNKDEARKWYEQARDWMEKNQPSDEELRRFRTETEALLKISGTQPTTKPRSQ